MRARGRAAGLDVVSLCLGDTSFDTPPKVTAVLKTRRDLLVEALEAIAPLRF